MDAQPALVSANVVLGLPQRGHIGHSQVAQILIQLLKNQRILPHPVGHHGDLGFAPGHAARVSQLFDEARAGLHVDRRRQHGDQNGLGPAHQIGQFLAMGSGWCIDDQIFRGAGQVPQALTEAGQAGDGCILLRTLRQPGQGRLLRIVVH